MKFTEYNGRYFCPVCGYQLAHNEYAELVANCPQCGEKVEREEKPSVIVGQGDVVAHCLIEIDKLIDRIAEIVGTMDDFGKQQSKAALCLTANKIRRTAEGIK
jgi:transcription initiation factor IIE alpha subunit